jgi:hypothetical protein
VTTRDEAIERAARALADGIALRDSLTPADAARAAWTPGGPSIAELERQIRADRGLPAA